MSFEGSYLWRLRQKVGHDLVLVPGAAVAAQRPDGQVLFALRGDDRTWCLPGGAAEEGGSFARTAIDELREETGLRVEPADLIPAACFSDAERHTLHYPSGDVAHYFSLLFLARRWEGEPTPDGEETLDLRFAEPTDLPQPFEASTARAVELLLGYLRSGVFQVG
ncbi:MAG TPA: NUDIX domain-containing protein [Solirubrobacterales bacterium]|nr:NUDIX domain-containing protein [Solirubrobacterales bacterium]